MSINLTDEIEVKTKKGKLGAAKQIFLEGDTQTVEKEIQEINSRHNDLSSTVSEHSKQIESNQSQITANKSAQDEKNASLDSNMAKLNTRDDQITELVKGVTATGGASVATAVTYDNTSSQLTSATVQGAVDELQGSKIDKKSILQESGEAEDKVMSQKATTTAIADEVARANAAEKAIIFDVSANNNDAVFESLQALLSNSNLSTLIPTSVRHGGMTIRFIQGSVSSSDNKYVQYRLIATSFSTTESDWQSAAIIGTDRIADGAVVDSKIGDDFKNITPQIADSVDNDLNIADEDGNVLAEFCDGHIRTKEFDSKKIVTAIEEEKASIIGTDRIADGAVVDSKIGYDFKNITPQIADSVDNDLNIADEDGNVLAEFCDGHIRTKEFDSKKIVTEIKVEKSEDGKNKLIIKK